MKKIYGIKNLIAYLDSVSYPLTEDQIHQLIQSKDIPHLRPHENLLVFNTDHIDWWMNIQQLKP